MSPRGDPELIPGGENDRIEVLHVEDDPAFTEIAERFLRQCDGSLDVTAERDPEQVLDRLADGQFDCVLSDYDMPGLTGIELLEAVRGRYPDLPFILFTGKGSEEVASDAFSAGATDYFGKPNDASEYELLAERIATVVEKHRTEQRLERSEERYQQLVEAMGDGVYALDAEGCFEMVNERMTELTGYSREELLGRHAGDVLTEAGLERSEAAIRSLLRREADSVACEVMARHADGTTVPRELTLTLQPTSPEQSFAGTVGVVHDITERRERERELEQKNERLEGFAEIVGHDLRNPLSMVSGHVELARERADEGAPGEELTPHLERIADATGRMTTLTDDLLALAKQGDTVGERESVALERLAREVWETLETRGANLETEALDSVEADPTRLRQLLANLLENAVEHGSTDSRPRADDAVEHGPTPHDSVSTDEPASADGGDTGDELTVLVRGTEDGFAVLDDGPGIPPEEHEAVFERGYSTAGGTGFGLAIVGTVAEAHDWDVTVGEGAAGGARFGVHVGD